MSPDAGPADPGSPDEPGRGAPDPAAQGGDPAAPSADPVAHSADPAREALARARRAAREKGLRPGMKPARRRRGAEAVFSGSQRDGRDPAPLGEQLDRLLAERGWQVDVAVGSVTGRWADIVGPDIAAHVVPEGFVGGVLTVRADSSAWATQMRLLSSRLLGRLAQEVGADAVTELVVKGPGAPRWTHGRRRVAGRGPRDTYG